MFLPMKQENTMPLLMAAITTGVVLIIISIAFNIFLNIKKKHWGDMLFSQNGLAGLIFYVSVLLLVANMLVGFNLPLGGPVYIALLIIMPIIMIFLKEPPCRRPPDRNNIRTCRRCWSGSRFSVCGRGTRRKRPRLRRLSVPLSARP